MQNEIPRRDPTKHNANLANNEKMYDTAVAELNRKFHKERDLNRNLTFLILRFN